jgi:hypothetical protein
MIFFQPELPKPEETSPDQQWGWYSFQDFLVANWGYISIVVFLVLVFAFYSKKRKQRRVDIKEQIRKERDSNASSTNL